jgi:PqqD family protein of HPr-rel-A system
VSADAEAAAEAGFGTARWRVRDAVELLWRDWGDDSVVLEARSAQIFHFDPVASAVMACLEQAPADIAAIAAALAADLDSESDDAFRHTVGEIVAHFHELGWVEPIIDR